MNKTNFARNMTMFLFFSEIIYLIVLFFVIYPFLGLSMYLIVKGMVAPVVSAMILIVIVSIIFYKKIKILDNLGASVEENRDKIFSIEKNLKRFFIYLNFIFFPIIMLGMTFITLFADGLLRWSTIRLLITGALIPQTFGAIQLIFLSYQIKAVKINANISEFKSERVHSLRVFIFFCTFSIFSFVIFNMTMSTITHEEKIAGISNVAYTLRKDTSVEKTEGYFTNLLDLAKKSTDENVKAEANKLIKNWQSDISNNNVIKIIIFSIIIFICFSIFSFILSTNISSHIISINDKLKNMVNLDGDLTHLIVKTTDNEIGELQTLINQFIYNVNKNFKVVYNTAIDIINETRDKQKNIENLINSNNEVTNTSNEISNELDIQIKNSNETSLVTKNFVETVELNINSISDQSSMIEEFNSSINQLNLSIDSISKATMKSFEIGKNLKEASEDNLNKISEMDDIIKNISLKSNAMSDIIITISNIADQTDMLAMNAAIEAAHAGESGKGFAVVSEEIRKLAENTSNQTKEIAQLLNYISEMINNAVEKSSGVYQSINNMQIDSNKTIELINEINNATQEQASGTRENVVAIQQLVSTTTTIMKNLEDQKYMSEKLIKTIENMDSSTQKIKLVGDKQKIYFNSLYEKLNDFQQYFYNITNKLEKLYENLNKLKFID